MTSIQKVTRKDKAVRSHGDKGYWVLGNITIDGLTGNITIKDTLLNTILTLDTSGISVDIPSTYSSGWSQFINFKKATVLVGGIALSRYVTVGVDVSDMLFRTYEKNVADSDTYVTLGIYDNGGTVRKNFFQLSTSYRASVLVNYGWNMGVQGKTTTFNVIADVDGLGYMKIPHRASDPAGAMAGSMYYNNVTNKFRGLEGGTWQNMV